MEDGATMGGRGVDMINALGVSRIWFAGRFDVTAGVTAADDLNRYFQKDVLNWNTSLTVRAGL
jgi:hypothetical protein